MKRKQELHKHSAVRLLFEKLAHSSIMRLNSSSMSKLFDLMLMAFKYQLLRMKFPEELYQITLNHLNSLVEIMSKFEGAATCELLQSVKNEIIYLNNTYSKLNCFDYITLKQNLFRFFQVRRFFIIREEMLKSRCSFKRTSNRIMDWYIFQWMKLVLQVLFVRGNVSIFLFNFLVFSILTVLFLKNNWYALS